MSRLPAEKAANKARRCVRTRFKVDPFHGILIHADSIQDTSISIAKTKCSQGHRNLHAFAETLCVGDKIGGIYDSMLYTIALRAVLF